MEVGSTEVKTRPISSRDGEEPRTVILTVVGSRLSSIPLVPTPRPLRRWDKVCTVNYSLQVFPPFPLDVVESIFVLVETEGTTV